MTTCIMLAATSKFD